jgi:hypothetical protein
MGSYPLAQGFLGGARAVFSGGRPCSRLSILEQVNHRPESRMREIRPYGSEGGEAKPNRLSLPLFPDERDSAAGRLKSPVREDKPQSHTPTLRYNSNNTHLRRTAPRWENTDQRGANLPDETLVEYLTASGKW